MGMAALYLFALPPALNSISGLFHDSVSSSVCVALNDYSSG
jgi:hypothetical protein